MDIVAGKNGDFFVVHGEISNTVRSMLLEISYDEFAKYNAYQTMKKITHQSLEEYASKNDLKTVILENFPNLEKMIDYHATQNLMFFISSEDGRERSEHYNNDVIIDPKNYSNGFLHAAPREVSGLITDIFQIPEETVPQMLKKVGISIKRETLSHFVKWNNITYKVDIVPARADCYRSSFTNKSLIVVENCYVFQSDDWAKIKKIEQTFIKEKNKRKKSWFLQEKPDIVLLENILNRLFKDKDLSRYTALYNTYLKIKDIRCDYIGAFMHEFHHLRNKILIENRALDANAKALSATDLYYLQVEDERSAAFASTIYRINRYWKNGIWEELIEKEPCFAVLNEKPQEIKEKLLQNMEFILNVKLQNWNKYDLERLYPKFVKNLPLYEAKNSIAKGEDVNHQEYLRQRSLMYCFYIYNPNTKKYKMCNLNKYIKIDIPIDDFVQKNLIDKAQYYIDRKMAAKKFLLAKEGISEDLIKKAAIIYDTPRRLRARRKK